MRGQAALLLGVLVMAVASQGDLRASTSRFNDSTFQRFNVSKVAVPSPEKNHTSAAQDIPKPRFAQLPPLPDREGFAAPFAGVSGGVLVVAGGANFPEKRPWEGGTKVWYDSVFVLEKPEGRWRTGFKLPRANAYGVSITTRDGIVCIGGSNAKEHFSECFLLKWNGKELTTTLLPSLPRPCAYMAGALAGDTIYVAGGSEKPDATAALKTFWALDKAGKAWRDLEPWPGPERILATAGALNGTFYLFSGASLATGTDAKPVRTSLRDAYSFTPTRGWQRIADLPRVAVAAPGPAPVWAKSNLFIISGDDGSKVGFKPETAHPGFSRDILAYDLRRDEWRKCGEAPFSRATTPIVLWRDHIVIPSGEARPGYRAREVWWTPLQ